MGAACSSAPPPAAAAAAAAAAASAAPAAAKPPLPPPALNTVPALDDGKDAFQFKDFSNEEVRDEDLTAFEHPGDIDAVYQVASSKLLGSGRFAVVCLARHRKTADAVAIKVVDKEFTRLKRPQRRAGDVYSEVRAMRALGQASTALQHHILPLLQVFEHPSKLFLVVPLARGGDLFDYINEHGALGNASAVHILAQLCSAVSHLHACRVVHHDIKPENILLLPLRGEGGVEEDIYLADFGLAEQVEDISLPIARGSEEGNDLGGSLAYSAPEVVGREYREYNGALSDMWGVGCVAYVVLTGAHPFREEGEGEEEKMLARIVACTYAPFSAHALALDFVANLLCLESKPRMDAKSALEHAWLKGDYVFPVLGEGEEDDVRSSDLNTPSEPSSDEGDDEEDEGGL